MEMASEIQPLALETPCAAIDGANRLTLTGLPPELLHIVFDFLFARHNADKAFLELDRPWLSKSKRHLSGLHPLDAISATSKGLRAQVNDWALHFLLKYKHMAPMRLPKAGQKHKTFNALRSRTNGLLNWADHHCIFCGKKTARFAIMMNGFRCCGVCDYKEWPSKITKTNARNEFHLTDELLLPHKHLHSAASRKLQPRFPEGLPRIRYGTYMSAGVATTMFLREDVERLAACYHPDLQAHLQRRRAMKEERARKREQKAAAVEATQASSSRDPAGRTADNPQYILDDED